MSDKRAKELLKKYLEGKCTDKEKAILESWYEHELAARTDPQEEPDYHAIGKEIWSKLNPSKYKVSRLWPLTGIAAAILICFSAGAYFILNSRQSIQTTEAYKNDIAPGSNKAILTLSTGHKIVLSGVKNGELFTQGGAKVSKLTGNGITYAANDSAKKTSVFNTLTTPRGGQYNLTLADGTRVWLNAASSISYPTTFTDRVRQVVTTGEVYFEVAHNRDKPFRVITGQQTVEVLGTHFNINAYNDEQVVKTTLLQGSIKVSKADYRALLKPGQQSQIEGNIINVIDHANLEEVIAWKNGYFRFNNEKINSIMAKLARWYDIDVLYEGKISDEGFYGTISRFKKISEVLALLQQTKGVHFKIEGRRVTVTG